MTDVVELLDPEVQEDLRRALHDDHENGLARYAHLLDEETIAALTVVGQYPNRLRGFALAIMPRSAREQLYAHRLVELLDPDDASARGADVGWALTREGEKVATVLATAAPELGPAERAQSEKELADVIAQGSKALGLDA